jgi:hypothetical protein
MGHIILTAGASPVLQHFSTLSHKLHDLRKKLLQIKCVLILSTKFVWNISHSKKKSARYCHKGTNVFTQSTRYYCHILMKLEFSRQIFEEYSPIRFQENPSSWSRVIPFGWTDGRTDMTKLTVAYRNFAKAPKKWRRYFLIPVVFNSENCLSQFGVDGLVNSYQRFGESYCLHLQSLP